MIYFLKSININIFFSIEKKKKRRFDNIFHWQRNLKAIPVIRTITPHKKKQLEKLFDD